MEKSDLKEQIAKDFLADSGDYSKRFDLLINKSMNHMGMRSKLYLELRFSAECCLKALYMLTTTETDLQNSYKKIIKHDFNKLIEMLPKTEQTEVAKYISDEMKNFDVDNRYLFETDRKFRVNGCLSQEYYDTISDITFLEREAKKMKDLREYVHKKVKYPIESFNFGEFDINEMLQERKELESLHKK